MDEGGEDDPNATPSLLPLGKCGNLRQRLILLLLSTSILILTKAMAMLVKQNKSSIRKSQRKRE